MANDSLAKDPRDLVWQKRELRGLMHVLPLDIILEVMRETHPECRPQAAKLN